MSFRGSFVTEYIYNQEDYKILRAELSKNNGKYFCITDPIIQNGHEIPIISGKVYDLVLDNEWTEVENRLSNIELSNPIKIVVVNETDTIAIIKKEPGKRPETRFISISAHENSHGK